MNQKTSIVLSFFLLIFFCFQADLYPQNRNVFPRIEPDPKALEYYNIGRENDYSWEQLAEISLWASGNTTPNNIERIRAAVIALNNSPELPDSDREKAEFILTYMHRNFLRTYMLYQTRIDTIFTNGSYNCVSSAALYIILCESAGIRTSGVMTREHAFVIVHIDGQDIDVETTNRYGFEPGNRREFHDQFGRLTGFSYVPAQNYRARQTITKIELISLILNNRIGDVERRNNFSDAVPLAVDRAALLLGNSLSVSAEAYSSEYLFADPRKDLMDRLINYGAALLRTNREEDGLRWAVLASSVYPDTERWQDFLLTAANNRIARFIRERKQTDARNFLENNKIHLTETIYDQLDKIVIDAELLNRANHIANAAEGNTILADIEHARDNGKMNDGRASELITFTIQKTAAVLCAAPTAGSSGGRDWRAAIRYIENAISVYGINRELEQNLRTYRGNLATDYHNRFAAEWNRRNYDEAERILNEGLEEFPDNRQLLNNRQTVNRHRARQ